MSDDPNKADLISNVSARLAPFFYAISGCAILAILGLVPRIDQSGADWVTYIMLAMLGAAWWGWTKRSRWIPPVLAELEAYNARIDSLSEKKLLIALVVACAMGLFGELMIIRIHSSLFQLFAHFKNVSLLSCFLGLGIGYATGKRAPQLMPVSLGLMAAQLIVLTVLVRVSDLNYLIYYPSFEGADIGFYMGLMTSKQFADFLLAYGLLGLAFTLNVVCFIPLGQVAARLMGRLPNLQAYSWNLVGSFAGIALFTLMSACWTTPVIWFGLFSIMFIALIGRILSKAATVSSALAVVALALLSLPTHPFRIDTYSPYQILSLIIDRDDRRLFACNTWFQSMLDLSPANLSRKDNLKPMADYYDLPYKCKPQPDSVLVVGSGTGNDVAAALRNGAKHVDAVEIDPAIISIGKELHPENPYADPRVTVIADDARSYIKRSANTYDVIVYGLLDSSAVMGGNSAGMRVDSYVWTMEAFREAKAKLRPGGEIAMTVCMAKQVGPKVYSMLTDVYGKKPLAYETVWDSGFMFLVGEGVQKPTTPVRFKEFSEAFENPQASAELGFVLDANSDIATDDWPFLFLFKRTYPYFYAVVLAILMAISTYVLRSSVSTEERKISWQFFFLGAGFMLIETKGITELCLVFGSTWIVNAAVIASILFLAFCANYLVIKNGPLPKNLSYILLIAALGGGIAFSIWRPYFQDAATERLVSTLVVTLPLFFSGFVFSGELKNCDSLPRAMYSNLLGAMLGGFVEYNAMYFGYRWLYYLAIAVYVAAFISSTKKPAAEAAASEIQTVADH